LAHYTVVIASSIMIADKSRIWFK